MHFQELKPKDIQQFIDEYRRGRSIRYIWCKEDTQEAIDGLYSLSYVDYDDIDALFNWFLDSFAMRTNSDGDSFYRAFLTLYNDDILNFRLSRHYSTENSTSGAFMQNGQPDIEYHLIIERVASTSSSPTITSTTDFMGTTEVIFEVSFNDFKNNGEWERFANELILYLTYGKKKGTNENKTRYNMNKKPIQLTEADLHNIVENVVSNMLNGMGIGQQQQGQQTQQTQSQQQTQQQPQQQQRQQQPQQQQGQQQNNNQITAYQQALTNYLNKMGAYMGQQFQELNRNVSIIQQQIRALNQRIPNSNSNM